MKTRIIPLVLVPIFALAACSSNQEPDQIATPNDGDKVVYNSDGSISQHPLLEQYSQAQAQGYTGSIDQFAELMRMYETNPQQAQQVAQESGFSGGEILLGALAGAALGAVAANAMSSKTNMASNTYSAQRANNANNYAYSQQLSKEEEEERKRRYAGGAIPATSSTSRGFAGASTTSTTTPKPVTTAPAPKPSVSSTSSRSTSFTSVSRGGFGGAVSSGG